jgi:hypothetical protein
LYIFSPVLIKKIATGKKTEKEKMKHFISNGYYVTMNMKNEREKDSELTPPLPKKKTLKITIQSIYDMIYKNDRLIPNSRGP